MSNNFNDVLNKYKTEINQFNSTWHDIFFQAQTLFEKKEFQLQNHDKFINNLRQKHQLITEQYLNISRLIDKPEIRLAITGTTSSGKSSLVNFLCGSEIMPRDALEMSAGMVSIIHSTEKKLVIRNTKNAKWTCGTWKDISDKEIQAKLQELMHKFHSIKDTPNLEFPKIDLYYPMRLGSQYEKLGLPKGCGITIVDLPGLNSSGNVDSINLQVIKEGAKNSLSIVTFNSEFATKDSEQDLLNAIISLIKTMEASPKHALFLQNRADASLRDASSIEEYKLDLSKKLQTRLSSIHSKIANEFKEYPKNEIQSIKLAKLSPLPALRAHRLLNSSEAIWKNSAEELDSDNKLFKDVIKKFPRDVEDWSFEQRQILKDAVLDRSFANEFDSYLGDHIKSNVKELIYHHQFNLLKKQVDEASALILGQLASLKSTVDEDSQKKQQNEIGRLQNELKRSISNLESDYENKTSSTANYYNERTNQFLNSLNKEANDVTNRVINAMQQLYEAKSDNDMHQALRNLESVFRVQDYSLQFLGDLSDNFLRLIERFARICGDLFSCSQNDIQTKAMAIYAIFREQQLTGAESVIDAITRLKNNSFFKQIQTETNWKISKSDGEHCQKMIDHFSRLFEQVVELFYNNYMSVEKYRVDEAFSTLKKSYIQLIYHKLKDYAGDSADYLLKKHSEKEFVWEAPSWDNFNAYVKTAKLVNSGGIFFDTWEILRFQGVLNKYASELKKEAQPKFATALQHNITRLMQNIEQETLDYLDDYQKELLRSLQQRKAEDISSLSQEKQEYIRSLQISQSERQREIELAIAQARSEAISQIGVFQEKTVAGIRFIDQKITNCVKV